MDFINHLRSIVTPALAAKKGSKSYFSKEIAIAYADVIGDIIFEWIENKKNMANSFDKNKISTKQQLLLIYYLSKLNILNLNKLHQDKTKQARLLSSLIDRNYENVRKGLNEIFTEKHKAKYFTKKNLEYISPILENLDQPSIISEINEEIIKVDKQQENLG